ncbi:NYN domain-containing protein [Homoserinimonas sp. A447]
MTESATAHLFIDYQNLHLSGHESFGGLQAPLHSSLIHPGLFANELQLLRNSKVHQLARITEIHVYRGEPSSQQDAVAAARNKAQAAEWTRDRRVNVHTRTLRYSRDGGPPREKGVDVMLAVDLVRCSISKSADVIILASRDTDLLPALETAYDSDGAIVEVAGWHGQSRLRFKNNEGRRPLWMTSLHADEFNRCRDPREY